MANENWQTRLVRTHADTIEELMMDYESVFRHEGFITFKSFLPDGQVLMFSISEDEFWEAVGELDRREPGQAEFVGPNRREE